MICKNEMKSQPVGSVIWALCLFFAFSKSFSDTGSPSDFVSSLGGFQIPSLKNSEENRGERMNPKRPTASAFQTGTEDPLVLNDSLNEEREKDSQKEQRIEMVLFNDNFGSNGNETGLTHGSRLVYFRGPADGENWSVSLESQLYLEDVFVIEQGKRARVHVVEQNSIEFEKRIPVSNSEYVILGVLAGYTTNRHKYFMPFGSKDQQELFHKLFNSWSDDIMDYEYDQERCYEILNTVYGKKEETLAEMERVFRAGCSAEDADILDRLSLEGFDCGNIDKFINATGAAIDTNFERALEQCNGKTKAHFGSKIAFGKIYRWDDIRNLCKKTQSDLSCITYLKVEGGLDLITVANDSTVYFFTEINQPLLSFGKEEDSVLSAFARVKLRNRVSGGKSEQTQTLGLQWSFRDSNLRLEVSQPENSLGRLFDIPNDDDSVVTFSYTFSF